MVISTIEGAAIGLFRDSFGGRRDYSEILSGAAGIIQRFPASISCTFIRLQMSRIAQTNSRSAFTQTYYFFDGIPFKCD